MYHSTSDQAMSKAHISYLLYCAHALSHCVMRAHPVVAEDMVILVLYVGQLLQVSNATGVGQFRISLSK